MHIAFNNKLLSWRSKEKREVLFAKLHPCAAFVVAYKSLKLQVCSVTEVNLHKAGEQLGSAVRGLCCLLLKITRG